MSDDRTEALNRFLQHHRLPESYLESAAAWFDPVALAIADAAKEDAPLLVGLNGSQGSGKSTVSDYLKEVWAFDFGLHTEVLSLDDVYLTRERRAHLAATVHPLLATRGVPGTHDIPLARSTLDRLLDPHKQLGCQLPRFDKANDDRQPESRWQVVTRPVDIILFEGWCLGVGPQDEQDLVDPVNALEAEEDRDGVWRHTVNAAIASDYVPLYDRVDQWVMLQAPSFACVHRWRLEQEDKLRQRAVAGTQLMDEAGITRFIQHYQRLTEHGLRTLPARVDHCLAMDEHRRITGYHRN